MSSRSGRRRHKNGKIGRLQGTEANRGRDVMWKFQMKIILETLLNAELLHKEESVVIQKDINNGIRWNR